jgi:thioredoxin 1
MKKLIGTVAIAIAAISLYSFSAATKESSSVHALSGVGIQFKDLTFEQAKAEAKKTGKLIFMDAYASWCGPCKMMDRNTFSDEAVGKFFNDKFINLKIDMEKSADGPTLSRAYSVTAYPTFLWIDGDGKVVKREMGYRTPEQFLALVKEMK